MHYELLPVDSPHAPLRHAAVDNQGTVKAVFEEERDANFWLEVTGPNFDPLTKHAITEMDLSEGTKRR